MKKSMPSKPQQAEEINTSKTSQDIFKLLYNSLLIQKYRLE
jgi:hypothetical protein